MAKKLGFKVYFDDSSGEVCTVECSKRLREEGPLFRLDVLKESVEILKTVYNYEKDIYLEENSTLAKA